MANFRYQIQITQADGTAFSSANEAGAAVRLRNSDSAGTNSSAYGSFTEVSNGYWYIDIDEEDSGWFLVQTYTTDSPTWTDLSGKDPIYLQLEPALALDGGTMSGDIDMNDNSITNLDTITFNAVTGTIAGIQNQNLVDKSAAETLSGNNTFSGNCTFSGTNTVSGEMDFTTDKLKINSIIVTPYIYVTKNFPGTGGRATANVNSTIFVSDDDFEVVGFQCSSETKESTNDCHIQLERLGDTEAAGSGDDILEDNGGLGVDLNSTAREAITATINSTNGTLGNGDRLGIYLTNAAADLEGISVTVKLKRV